MKNNAQNKDERREDGTGLFTSVAHAVAEERHGPRSVALRKPTVEGRRNQRAARSSVLAAVLC